MIRTRDEQATDRRSIRLGMRTLLTAGAALIAFVSGVLAVQPTAAQAQATLVGRAILPAAQLADGPSSGNVLAKASKSINGIDFPLTSQPFSGITGIWPGEYGSWLLLTGTAFNSRADSSDVLLRLYTAQVDWRTASGGTGQVTAVDWISFDDSLNKLTTALVNPGDTRSLTGADLSPRGLATADGGKTWWVGENSIPAVLHINAKGALLISPRALTSIGVETNKLQGIGITPSGKLMVIASDADASHIAFHVQDVATGANQGGELLYPRDTPNDLLHALDMISETSALVVESDGQGGASAGIKRVYLVDFSSGQKTLVADLMQLADPSHLGTDAAFGDQSGQIGLNPFTYPFEDISGVYLSAPDTIVVVNNNHMPYNTARKAKTAENTEMIEIKLAAPIPNVTQAFGQS